MGNVTKFSNFYGLQMLYTSLALQKSNVLSHKNHIFLNFVLPYRMKLFLLRTEDIPIMGDLHGYG